VVPCACLNFTPVAERSTDLLHVKVSTLSLVYASFEMSQRAQMLIASNLGLLATSADFGGDVVRGGSVSDVPVRLQLNG